MNIEYELTHNDIIEFNLFHMSHSPNMRRQTLYTRALLSLLVIIMIFSSLYFVLRISMLISFIGCTFGGVFYFFIYPFVHEESVIRYLKKMLSEGDNKTVLGHRIISLFPDGIFFKSQTEESKLNWSAIDKVVQNEKFIFLYTSSTNAVPIPKKCFSSIKSQQDFFEYIKSHCEQNNSSIEQ